MRNICDACNTEIPDGEMYCSKTCQLRSRYGSVADYEYEVGE